VTTPSFFAQNGISISAYTPTIAAGSYNPRGLLLDSHLAQNANQWSHEIQAMGGWWSATLGLAATVDEAEDWFWGGLNRHVEVYNSSLARIWAGFVNQVTLNLGTLSAVRGPLMDVVNRGSVVYTPILDPTTSPPIEGSESTTTIADDAASQAAYGILEGVISGGRLLDDGTTDDAVTLRDTYIEENKDPQTSEDLDLSSGREVTVQLDLLGYVHRFQKYVYQDVTTATIQVDAKIPLVIAADPNGLFSTDYSQIATNATLTSRFEDDNRIAWDVLSQEVALGDAASNRYTLGVYGGQQVVYAPVPTTAAYQHRVKSLSTQIETYGSGVEVKPWDVLPARWVFLTDFLTGLGQPAALREDPRYVFIESVQFTAPSTLQIQGQKVSRLPQMLARFSG
jgi:hypothetical protein